MNLLESLNRFLALPFLALVWIYQKLCRPIMPGRCRFHPSCGDFSKEALDKHGFMGGILLTTHRIARCHPFNPGGIDHVPQTFSWRRLFALRGPQK